MNKPERSKLDKANKIQKEVQMNQRSITGSMKDILLLDSTLNSLRRMKYMQRLTNDTAILAYPVALHNHVVGGT